MSFVIVDRLSSYVITNITSIYLLYYTLHLYSCSVLFLQYLKIPTISAVQAINTYISFIPVILIILSFNIPYRTDVDMKVTNA